MPIANHCDPQLRLRHIRIRLRDAIEHMRADVRDIEEPQLRAILETSAEVLSGLVAAFDRYEQKTEPVRREPARLRRSG
jgi:hypothetical protein